MLRAFYFDDLVTQTHKCAMSNFCVEMIADEFPCFADLDRFGSVSNSILR